MRTVLAFDLSLTCSGWATWTGGQLATGRFTPKGLAGRHRRRWIAERAADLADTNVDPLVVIEAVPTHGARDIVALGELHGVVLDHLDGYRPAYVTGSTVKKWATGNGNAPKDKMEAAARELLGWNGPTDKQAHNEADAAWLAMIGRQLLGDVGPLFTEERRQLLRVTWPEGRDVALGGVA